MAVFPRRYSSEHAHLAEELIANYASSDAILADGLDLHYSPDTFLVGASTSYCAADLVLSGE